MQLLILFYMSLKITKLVSHIDPRGELTVLDLNKVPFVPARLFYVQNSPKGQVRGNHAHRINRQYLICTQGAIEVRLHDGRQVSQFMLGHGNAVLVNTMVWNTQTYLTGRDMLFVLCSHGYDPQEYISDFSTFLKLHNENSSRHDRTEQ
jgi:dTDP-4-dehydrorhamnose 3,5-epimerase-like enzyme